MTAEPAAGAAPPSSQPPGTYKTTRPVIPPQDARQIIRLQTNSSPRNKDDSGSSHAGLRIELRPFKEKYLNDFHRLRTQYEVMQWTSTGRCDADMEATRVWMHRFLPPNDATTFNVAIFVSENHSSSTGEPAFELIGAMGCHITSPVAHVGYMLRKEWWGRGIATAAVKAFLDVWWSLERKVVDLEFDPSSEELHGRELEYVPRVLAEKNDKEEEIVEDVVDQVAKQAKVVKQRGNEEGQLIVPEVLLAEIESTNGGSKKVIERCGFQFRTRKEEELDGQKFGIDIYTQTMSSM